MTHVFTRRRARTAVALLATGGLLSAGLVVTAGAASAAPPSTPRAEKGDRSQEHDLRSPQAVKQDALKQKALQKVIAGKATPTGKNKVVQVAKGQYVELARESTDKIFVVLAEFGDVRHPAYPDLDPDTRPTPAQKFTGPLHNQIPAPDRAVDNSTLWKNDYSKAHYEDMYFNRMAKYYQSQSSGRYSVEGAVTEWVKVPFNEARYGRNYCGSIVCPTTRNLIRDSLASWVDQQLKGGKTLAQVTEYLKTFDVQDRYDADGDGNFAEPDGFIDHFQIVHAGGDEAAGDPIYGEDAIWSHRSYAAVQAGGPGGFTGVNVGSGLVDQGQTHPEQPDGHLGRRLHDPARERRPRRLRARVRPRPRPAGPLRHLRQHRWRGEQHRLLDADVLRRQHRRRRPQRHRRRADRHGHVGEAPARLARLRRRPAPARSPATAWRRRSPASKQEQALLTELPDKAVPLELGAPCSTCGSRYFYSDAGDDLNNTMTRVRPLGWRRSPRTSATTSRPTGTTRSSRRRRRRRHLDAGGDEPVRHQR